jgi:hypothetical protein
MRNFLRSCLAVAWLFAAATASATFHTFRIDQLFSNADGTVQFCVMHEASGLNGQEFWTGHAFTSTHGGVTNTFVFPNNLPSSQTSGRRVLIATQGFAALGLVIPDYVVSNGFFSTGSGAVNFAGVDQVSYRSLPTDGAYAIDRNGNQIQDLATNFGGKSASVAQAPEVAPRNYQGLWWTPGESGWGINFAHQANTIFATWFVYDAAGKPSWLIAKPEADAMQPGVYTGDVWAVTGSPFGVEPFNSALTNSTVVGKVTLNFADADNATFSYDVNGVARTTAITHQKFGPLPACVWGAQPDLRLATNYTDLWWSPPEDGWGINFTHQGNIIFATWFTYDAAGKSMWLIAQAEPDAGGAGVYSGPIWTVTGTPFGVVPFVAGQTFSTEVGRVTLTFADGNSATLSYNVNGVARTKAITREVFAPPGTVCQ